MVKMLYFALHEKHGLNRGCCFLSRDPVFVVQSMEDSYLLNRFRSGSSYLNCSDSGFCD